MAFRRKPEIEMDAGVCLIRSWRRSDKASLLRYADNRNVSRNLRDAFPYPYTSDDADYWLSYARSREPETNFAIELNGEAIGGIGYTLNQDVYRKSAEIGYWLGEPFWGRGIAVAALRLVTDYAFRNHDLHRIHAGVFGWNPGSMRVLEKAGYEREAVHRDAVYKLGEFTDEVVYVRFRDPA